jgi:hypothetical protein
MLWGNWYWPAGLAVMLAWFAPAELFALLTNVNNTLSDYCWRELDVTRAMEISGHGVAWWCSFLMWIAFVITITLHIWYRGA